MCNCPVATSYLLVLSVFRENVECKEETPRPAKTPQKTLVYVDFSKQKGLRKKQKT